MMLNIAFGAGRMAVVVKGIRIRKAEDKHRIKELLKEQAESQMEME